MFFTRDASAASCECSQKGDDAHAKKDSIHVTQVP